MGIEGGTWAVPQRSMASRAARGKPVPPAGCGQFLYRGLAPAGAVG
jgi:hypothetical protein